DQAFSWQSVRTHHQVSLAELCPPSDGQTRSDHRGSRRSPAKPPLGPDSVAISLADRTSLLLAPAPDPCPVLTISTELNKLPKRSQLSGCLLHVGQVGLKNYDNYRISKAPLYSSNIKISIGH
ncbi:hypothetical protein AMECASPLE_025127, partial [Ameca splendens]